MRIPDCTRFLTGACQVCIIASLLNMDDSDAGGAEMPNLQVREVPAHVYGQLKEQAAKEHRSLAQQTLITIERGLETTGDAKERRRTVLARIGSRHHANTVALPDPVGMVREDRRR